MRAILTYHSIDDSGSPISVAREAFTRHVRWLASGRVEVTSVPDLLARPDDADAVAVTFDDGFRSFEEEAWPRLSERGLSAAMFVVTEHVGGVNAWTRTGDAVPILPLLEWNALGRLHEAGVELGGHTRTHPDLAALPIADALGEVDGSLEEIERRTGCRPRLFAYPFGRAHAALADALTGRVAAAVTTEHRWVRPGERATLVPRLDMFYFQAPGALEAWGTRAFRMHVATRRALRAARRAWVGAASRAKLHG